MSKNISHHFEKIARQRFIFNNLIETNQVHVWERPQFDKWSIGESYYHLYLMVKRFRQLNRIYIPLAKPIAFLWKRFPYQTRIHNIYQAYNQKNGKSMKAPSVIVPPQNPEQIMTFDVLLEELDKETRALADMVSKISDDLAGHIRYPDPLAHYPNLIQSIDLIGIHEEHHFERCRHYYQIGN